MNANPVVARQNLLLICAASAGWSFSFGLGAPLTSLWLSDLGHSDTLIGLNTTTYYLGIAVAAAFIPLLMRRLGRGCVVTGAMLSGLSLMPLPWISNLACWYLIRLVTGVAGAMSLIPLETAVNRGSEPAHRARNFGIYAFSVALGWALGNGVGLESYSVLQGWTLVLGGIPSVAAGFLLWRWLPGGMEPAAGAKGTGSLSLRRNFLSYGSAWSQGFLEGGMVGFLAIYLLFLGLSETRVSWLTSGIMIGVILFQIPVAWMADRFSRRSVLLGCYAITALSLAVLPFCGDSAWLVACLFAAGACSGAFYPLGLAILGEHVNDANLARANAWYLGINCCGSLVGPFVTGLVMDAWGRQAMFVAAEIAVLSALAGWFASHAYRGRSSGPPATAPGEHNGLVADKAA